jgi:hypothetical protein
MLQQQQGTAQNPQTWFMTPNQIKTLGFATSKPA